jgi:nicotinate-nucleotide--dimethylbenzimidazole phosphoribosyltransferase
MIAAVTGLPVDELAGAGAGLDAEGVKRKAAVLERALTANTVDPDDPLDLLAKLGGFEIGCIAGLCLGGAAEGMLVFADGVISAAGAYVAWELSPDCRGRIVWSHRSEEPAHSAIMAHMEVEPLLDLGMRLGEGTGAAVAMWLAETAVATAAGMATFDEAAISDKD